MVWLEHNFLLRLLKFVELLKTQPTVSRIIDNQVLFPNSFLIEKSTQFGDEYINQIVAVCMRRLLASRCKLQQISPLGSRESEPIHVHVIKDQRALNNYEERLRLNKR